MVVAVSTERYRAVCHPLVRRQVEWLHLLSVMVWSKGTTATDMDGTLLTDLWKPETSREIKKFCHRKLTLKVQFRHFLTNHNSSQDCFKKNPLSMLILGQKDCILGPTFFKIPQPNGHYSTHYIHETSKLRQIFRGKIPLFLVLYIHAQVFNKGSQWKHSCLCGRPHKLSKYILQTDSEKIVESRVTNHYVLFLLWFLMNQSLSNCCIHSLRNDYTVIKLYSLYLAHLISCSIM